MLKRSQLPSDLLAIALWSPWVATARTQMLALEAARPTRRGRREAVRMTAEKSEAFVESTLAAQKSLMESGMRAWSRMAMVGFAQMSGMPAASLAAAAVPVRRRVRRNARRLTGL